MNGSDWWSLDLSLLITYTGGITFALLSGLSGTVRVVLVIPLVVFVPGYALISVFYPDRPADAKSFDDTQTGLNNPVPPHQGIGTAERVALSAVVSMVIIAAIAIAATVSPWGISHTPLLLGVSVSSIGLAIIAILRRWRCPPDRRFDVTRLSGIGFRSSTGSRSQPYVTVFNIAVVISFLVLLGSVGYALANPPQGEAFTEFYIETEEVTGQTETMYEASFEAGEPSPLTVHIINHEHQDVEYTTVVLLQDVTYDDDDVTVHSQTELAQDDAMVTAGEHYPLTLEITPTSTESEARLLVLLYDGDVPEDPGEETAYRVLRLPVEVE